MGDGTHYDTLGVTADADQDQIRQAYRDMAKAFHPDRYDGAPDAVKAHAQRTMAAVNEANHVLSDPDRRARYDRTIGVHPGPAASDPPPRPQYRPPADDECMLCGHGPAQPVTVRRNVGLLISRKVFHLDGPMCRDCGQALLRDAQARSVWTGWWGVISVFANAGNLFVNAAELWSLRDRTGPKRRRPDVVAPADRPLHPGKPLHLRGSMWAFAAVVALLVVPTLTDQDASATPTAQTATSSGGNTGSTGGGTSSAGTGSRQYGTTGSSGSISAGTRLPNFTEAHDLIGECFTVATDDSWNPTSCISAGAYEIVDVVWYETGCSRQAVAAPVGNYFVCIE